MFDIIYERSPLYEEIKHNDWIEYCLNNKYGNHYDNWLYEYVLNYNMNCIEHYELINSGYNERKQILELINVKLHEILKTKTYHNGNAKKLYIYSIKNSDYDLFIDYKNYILIRKGLKNVFDDFRFPNMCYKIYDKSKKEYIIAPNEREKILKNTFKIEQYKRSKMDDIGILGIYINITEMMKGLGN
jgi:hypothetical protein